MAYIRLPGGIRVALEYEVFGKIVVNIYHVTTEDPIVSLKLLNIAEAFVLWWANNLSGAMSQDIALNQVTALNLDVPNGEKQTLIVSPADPGGLAEPAMSNNVALVASFATAQTGRSYRGRAYHAGISEPTVTANEITVAFAAGMVGTYAALFPYLDGDNAVLVVASFQSGGVPRAEGVATPVLSVSVNLRVDTQRRRLPTS